MADSSLRQTLVSLALPAVSVPSSSPSSVRYSLIPSRTASNLRATATNASWYHSASSQYRTSRSTGV
eukprot:1755013-Rhodomonas_salina.1